MAIGNVHVFNATPNNMALILNNHVLAANIAGAQSAQNHQPSPSQASRNRADGNPGVTQFSGDNTLIVSFPDGTSQTYPVKIPTSEVDDDDLQLHIFFNQLVLVTPSGDRTSIVIEGTAARGRDNELIRELVSVS
jgi:hypothetical protein